MALIRMRIGIAALVGAACLALAAAPAADARPPQAGFYGMSPQAGPLSPEDFTLMGRAHVGTLRLFFRWPQVQKVRGGPYDWTAYDALVRQAAAHGIRIMGGLTGTPDWISCDLSKTACRLRPAVHTQAAREHWAAFVHAVANRYGPGGTFWRLHPWLHGGITTWQVWNEQNSVGRYKPRPSPREYAKLLEISHRALRLEIGSRATVVMGGMFGTPPRKRSMDSWTFLRRLYRVHGARRAFDGIALHPYSPTVRGIRYQISRLRSQMRRSHDTRTGIWVTEVGWGSARTPHKLTKGTRGQARMLREAFSMLVRNRARWNLRGVYWYSWRDYPSGQGCPQWCTSSGLLRHNYHPKPSFYAYRTFTSRAR